jgi:hypothetical protein
MVMVLTSVNQCVCSLVNYVKEQCGVKCAARGLIYNFHK